MDTSAPTTVSSTETLSGTTSGPVTVLDGGSLTLSGTHDGTVTLRGGATLVVSGVLNGGLDVESLATATVSGDVLGGVIVRVAGTLVIEAAGRVAGPITNHGSFTNRGTRNGPVEGRGPDDQEGSVIVEPQHPGVYNYVLPARD